MPFPFPKKAKKPAVAKIKAPNAEQKEPNSGGGLPFFNPTKSAPKKKKKAPIDDYNQDGM